MDKLIKEEDKVRKNYYVYIYLDPRKTEGYKYGNLQFILELIYVGKGTKNRMKQHLSPYYRKVETNKFFYRKLSRILKTNKPVYFIYENNLTEENALKLETELVKLIGRINLKTGPLTNLTDGGEKGKTNRVITYKARTHSGTFKIGSKPKHIKKGWRLQPQEEKDKRSIRMMGHEVTNETRLNIIKNKGATTILQYSLEGDFIKEWLGIRDAKRNGFKSVSSALFNNRRFANNYLWLRNSFENIPLKIDKYIAPKQSKNYKNI